MNRRDVIRLGTAAAMATALGARAEETGRKLRILMLGGTGFIGPHFVNELRAAGHTLTLFNRGKRQPGLFPDLEVLIGDRDGKVDALQDRDWDVVIDNSGYVPRHVRLTAELLRDHVEQYVFISTISVYADFAQPGIDEDYELATLADPNVEDVTPETYGGLKTACERVVEEVYGTRAALLRPSYIVGPGDSTDRFTYWPVRVARGGEMLVPGTAADPIQFIDARDLAQFVRRCVEERISGRYNMCTPPGGVTMGDLLETSLEVTGSDARFVWANADFLAANQALQSGEIPIWAPPQSEFGGAALISSARAVGKGLRFRDLQATVSDTLAWHEQRPAEQRKKLRAGLSTEREVELLQKLRERAA